MLQSLLPPSFLAYQHVEATKQEPLSTQQKGDTQNLFIQCRSPWYASVVSFTRWELLLRGVMWLLRQCCAIIRSIDVAYGGGTLAHLMLLLALELQPFLEFCSCDS